MNSQDAETIDRAILSALAPLDTHLAATEAAVKVQADGVRFVHSLIALIADPKAAAKRLADLDAAAGKLAKERVALDRDQKTHTETVAKDRAEIEKLRADATARADRFEAELKTARQRIAILEGTDRSAERAYLDKHPLPEGSRLVPVAPGVSTMTQEFFDGPPVRDPHYGSAA